MRIVRPQQFAPGARPTQVLAFSTDRSLGYHRRFRSAPNSLKAFPSGSPTRELGPVDGDFPSRIAMPLVLPRVRPTFNRAFQRFRSPVDSPHCSGGLRRLMPRMRGTH